MENQLEIASLAGGCFWCLEAIYEELKGVNKVISGYMGGQVEDPTYEEVCTGVTGHTETVQVYFDPHQISYQFILEVFWHMHDPTTLNKQGNDIGTQYRSVIFFHNNEQEKLARESKAKIEQDKLYPNKIVTEIIAAPKFYPAEEYHQDFYLNHPDQFYCRVVIDPKVTKFRKEYLTKLK